MWLVEPLGWALLVARGGNPELEAKGDAHAEEQMQLYLNAGWRRITEEDEEFKELWNQLHDWLSGRKIGLSARKGVRAIFWTAPESTDD